MCMIAPSVHIPDIVRKAYAARVAVIRASRDGPRLIARIYRAGLCIVGRRLQKNEGILFTTALELI